MDFLDFSPDLLNAATEGSPTLSMQSDFQERLQDMRFHPRACEEAIAGTKIPEHLGATVVQLCVIRGIRYHAGFGQELRGVTLAFTRALNAQAIMNNIVPDMHSPEEIPYCMWHPSIPSQRTCRELVHRYPQTKYQVARICAIADYIGLYCDLDVLPEVHVAEEARESGNLAIYNMIINQPVKYAVFNDYTRAINYVDPPTANLNGDTMIVAELDFKQKFRRPPTRKERDLSSIDLGFEKHEMDITEDMCIDTFTSERSRRVTNQDIVIPLLYSALPCDLPTVQKDLLILVAAYHGDIDRYARLRRPYMIPGECICLVRAIYHSPIFAKWCSLQPVERMRDRGLQIIKAINARFIMSNDLSRVTAQTDPFELPFNIWYPQPALPIVYEALARRVPSMLLQAARACIIADYQDSFDNINPPYDEALAEEAKISRNPFYLKDLLEKRKVGNRSGKSYWLDWQLYNREHIMRGQTRTLLNHLEPENIGTIWDGVYNGIEADLREIEVSICAAPSIKASGLTDFYEIYGDPPASAPAVL